jgi:hypothetical protein
VQQPGISLAAREEECDLIRIDHPEEWRFAGFMAWTIAGPSISAAGVVGAPSPPSAGRLEEQQSRAVPPSALERLEPIRPACTALATPVRADHIVLNS